ncbi:glycoside hydrolase family 36 protein [Planosporangium sp. 12N6]|uniref:glycoside hydrolase family 36 protein n=1 Tax=Planosporangium spinosum TaxID=3402278 RepID=UPI003CEFCE4B
MPFETIDEVPVDPARARVYEHGWQSWSPTTTYPADATSWRPVRPPTQVMSYRPGRPGPERGFQGEGLLAVDPGDGGAVRLYAAGDGVGEVASIRASLVDGRVRVSADGPVEQSSHGSIEGGLAAWGDAFARTVGAAPPRPAPTVWCSWYHYFTEVTEADVDENLGALVAHDLPVDVVQVDDGWQSEIGDWLTLSGRFASLSGLVGRVRDAGRRTGIWVAPFLVSQRSETAREHPDWLLRDAAGDPVDAGFNWDAPLYALDATHPGVRGYLTEAFTRLRGYGIDYFKIDFIYAGALDGVRHDGSAPLEAYRSGVRLIREAIGAESYLLGCGAPILPSVGLVDAMRVSADVAPTYEPADGDASQPSQYGATISTVGRAWQHGRFWVNDPDCVVARPQIERRAEWAEVVARYGGLRASSDRIAALDDWGLETTRRLLTEVPPPTPFS